MPKASIAIIGGGPAGLMAAQWAAGHGYAVHVYEQKASVGRKFLIAGRGGLNLTHSEAFDAFCSRFDCKKDTVARWLKDFDNQAIRQWAQSLGIETFVGSSGRVFPTDMKAAPLLRAWLKHLRELGVNFHMKHFCTGLSKDNSLLMQGPEGLSTVKADAVIFALGGGSWPQLGSDGTWIDWMQAIDVNVEPLQAANCGFNYSWTAVFKEKFSGHAIKPLRINLHDDGSKGLQGECVISEYGIEGSLIYALSRSIRESINQHSQARIYLDLLPDHSPERLQIMLSKPRNGRSLTDVLRRLFNLSPVKISLIYELSDRTQLANSQYLISCLKQLPLTLTSARPIAEAISTAGGIALPQLDEHLMLKSKPGIFFAGEMLDWEAPTGGYLLTASMASGRTAGLGALRCLQESGL
ncbi:MAG TPA: TIGR03862 family flavoprotein [Arenimonas sp.]|nr:TIGR03862 family flavoprotein [Arenimonas sp.]